MQMCIFCAVYSTLTRVGYNCRQKQGGYIMEKQQSLEQCIKSCLECMEACNICYDSCLKEEDLKMMVSCIRLDRECADICALAVKSMQSNSPFVNQICILCAEICEACGNECKNHHHEHCQKCAEACFRCAEECRKFAA